MSAGSGATFGQKLTKEDWKKRKELEEARKAGTAPAEVDEEGRDINPHIPQYISQAPWYVSLGRPSLTHQRPQEERQKRFDELNKWYKRGESEGPAANKFRKGACENCGAMTHKKKDCLERPRKVGAMYSGKNIRADEASQPHLDLTWDGKRDRWNGYDADDHRLIVEEYNKVEMAKRQLKADKIQKELLSEVPTITKGDSDDSEDDEDKYADLVDMPGTKFDSKTRTTVRNLRIREDTAKYLHNLDPNSAFYDPKTRSMRENPFQGMNKDPRELVYAGDNFVRHKGDITGFARNQMFAWEAFDHGTDIHPQADPTKLELMHKEFHSKKKDFKTELQQSILEKYGGEEHLDVPARELQLAQTEHYVEYSRLGNVIRGQDKAVAKSRYEEDVYSNNHTSIWGSFWENGCWGYACCCSMIRGSYCTGESGKMARKISRPTAFMAGSGEEEEEPRSLLEQHQAKMANQSKKGCRNPQAEIAEEEKVKEEKLRRALRKESEREKEADRLLAMDERKRPYNSMKADDAVFPTDEEMEAYRLKKRREEDPMASLLTKR